MNIPVGNFQYLVALWYPFPFLFVHRCLIKQPSPKKGALIVLWLLGYQDFGAEKVTFNWFRGLRLINVSRLTLGTASAHAALHRAFLGFRVEGLGFRV